VSEIRQPRPLLSTLSLFTATGVVVSLAFALVDGIRAGSGEGAPLLGGVALALCLYPVLGLGLGLATGLVLGGLRAVVWPGPGGLWTHLRRSPEVDRAVAAGLLAGAGCLGIEVLVVYLYAGKIAAAMANPRLAALSTGLVAGGGLGLCVLLFFPIFHLLRRPSRWIPRIGAASLVVVLLLVLVVAIAAGLVLSTLDWRMLPFAPVVVVGLMGLALLVAGGLMARRGSRWQRPAVLGIAVVLALGLGLTAPYAGRDGAVVSAAQQGGLLLPTLLSAGRAIGDGDGDGFSAWFNGGDCDDEDPGVHPGARDLPGNGVDENCIGGDARPRTRPTRPKRPAAPKPGHPRFDGNVLVVCIDTVRADKLGALGHGGGLTPNLDRLAAGGVIFTRAIAQGPNTPQSFPSTFTSQYPPRVPVRRRFTGYPALTPEALTYFEVLEAAGVTTAAVSSHFYFKPKRGITQGVPDWDNRDATNLKDSNKDVASPRIVPRAITKLRELAAAKRRFVIFVHLFEPHSTYVTHPGLKITERGVKGLQQKYDFEIKFADRWLGTLLQGLEDAGLAQDTAVIAYSDHGEAFGEHRFYFHGQALYNEVIHVPLIIRLPGSSPPVRKVTERVALIDLAPTILDLMGAPIPEGFQGISLVPLVYGGKGPAQRKIGAVLMPYPAWPKGQQALLAGRYKALLRVTENRFEVYDLERDPREQTNLALKDPELAKRLKAELASFAEEHLQ
jgi:arylsulfatase A-like enzyme